MKFFVRAAAFATMLISCSLASGGASAASLTAICSDQTYALCASAQAFVYQEISYAKCIIKKGNSISAPPLDYSTSPDQNICDFNAAGVGNGFMSSTFSLPEETLKGGSKALYTCPGGSTGAYAQCDGGTCFKSTQGKVFPGLGKLKNDEIICSCPITKANTSIAPFGYQFVGPYPCQQSAFDACKTQATNGVIIPVGSPPGAGRVLAARLYNETFKLNECRMN